MVQTIKFVYSYPYEAVLLKLANKKLTQEHNQICREKVKTAQKIWDRYEDNILNLFKEIYKIDITEKLIKIYISLTAPNSYSDPLTISLKRYTDLETKARSKRGFVYTTIHELAHYFSYTRGEEQYFNKLHNKIQKINLLGEHGANLHYLIQAVEFGIIGEIFGQGYAKFARDWTIENSKDTEYGKSAKLLKDNNIPFDKTCLEYINDGITNKS